MDDDSTNGQSIGKITSGITKEDALALSTIAFVYQQLPYWRDDPDRPDEKSEDNLNLQLCKFLDSRARRDFAMVCFDHEEPQVGRRKSDMAASPTEVTVIGVKTHTIYTPFLVFEGKRLPAPSSAREKEYVTSFNEKITGGIQRFKLGLHGAGMTLATMIGYIQEGSPSEWHDKINEWITDLVGGSTVDGCIWNDNEKLKLIDQDLSKRITNSQSVHSRHSSKVSDEIRLQHLWITMNTNKRLTEQPS